MRCAFEHIAEPPVAACCMGASRDTFEAVLLIAPGLYLAFIVGSCEDSEAVASVVGKSVFHDLYEVLLSSLVAHAAADD